MSAFEETREKGAGGNGVALADIVIFLILASGLFYLDRKCISSELYQGFITIIGSFCVVLGIARLRGLPLRALGVGRPRRIWAVPLWVIAIFTTTLFVAGGGQWLAMQFIDASVDISKFSTLYGNLQMLIISLVSVWVTAAFMEEVVYRGFLMNRLMQVLGAGVVPVITASLIHSIMFGLLHLYQGPVGVITTGVVAFVFGIFFALQGRNIWSLIVVHGLIDTLSIIQFYIVGVPMTG